MRPDTLPMSDQELREAICAIIRTRYDDAVCNITIDHDFLEIDTTGALLATSTTHKK